MLFNFFCETKMLHGKHFELLITNSTSKTGLKNLMLGGCRIEADIVAGRFLASDIAAKSRNYR
jgi:hypothetical protein